MRFLPLTAWFVCLLRVIAVATLTPQELEHLSGDPPVTHKVHLAITKGGIEAGELVLALFGETVPVTVTNYVELATLKHGYGYAKSHFHRIVQDFVVQGGDFEKGNGHGGYSIYGKGRFDDENFDLKHSKKGRLSMANAGPNTNGAQFFITTGDNANFLDGKHVVFGQLIDGFDLLSSMNNAECKDDMPVEQWTIAGVSVDVLEDLLATFLPMSASTETPMPDLVDDSLSGYKYLFFFCLVVVVAWSLIRRSRLKHTVIDIKDERIVGL